MAITTPVQSALRSVAGAPAAEDENIALTVIIEDHYGIFDDAERDGTW